MAASRIHAVLVDAADRFVAVAADDALFLHDWSGTKCVCVPRAPNATNWRGGLCTDPTDSSRVLMLQFDMQQSLAQIVSIDAIGMLSSEDPFVRIGPVAHRYALFDAAAVARAQSDAYMVSRWTAFDYQMCRYPRMRTSLMQHTANGAMYVVDGRAWIWKFAANDHATPPVRVPLFIELPINAAATNHLDVNVVLASRDDLLFVAHAARITVVRDEAVIFALVSPEYVIASPPSLNVGHDFVVIGCENGTAAVLRFGTLPLDRDRLSWLNSDPARRAQLDRWRIGDEWPDETCFFAPTEFVLECVAASDSVTPMYGRDTSGVGAIGNNVWVGQGGVLMWFARDRCLEPASQYVHATTDINELVDNTTFGTHGQYLMVGSDSAMRSSALIDEARALLPAAPQATRRTVGVHDQQSMARRSIVAHSRARRFGGPLVARSPTLAPVSSRKRIGVARLAGAACVAHLRVGRHQCGRESIDGARMERDRVDQEHRRTRRRTRMSGSSIAVATLALLTLSMEASVVNCAQFRAQTVFEFNSVPFDWLSQSQEQQFIQQGWYNASNCAIAGVKSVLGRVFVTVPRWRRGVPATLLAYDAQRQVFQPFPDWQSQAYDNQSPLFMNVQSMEIDPLGRMWVLDVARMNFLEDPQYWVDGTPTLVLLDAAKGRVLDQFVFDASVLSPNASFANDIVVDWRNDIAYISDTWGDGGLVVVDLRQRLARRFDHASCHGDPQCVMQFPEGPLHAAAPSDGIALTPDGSQLFYCSISTTDLWTLDATVLRDFTQPISAVAATVTRVGDKLGYSDGLAMTNASTLFFGDLTGSRIMATTNLAQFSTSTGAVVSKAGAMEWPDTFAFDDLTGSLLFTSNKLQLFLNGTMQFGGSNPGINFRLWQVSSPTIRFYSYMN
jgi:sugar lactone lactonase YvrE